MIEIEECSGNVYADLQSPDAQAMYVKAQLASKIGDIIRHNNRLPRFWALRSRNFRDSCAASSVALAKQR